MLHDDSLTTMMLNSFDIDQGIVGTNSSLMEEYQMSDPSLKWLRPIIQAKEPSQNKYIVSKKDFNNIQKKMLKYAEFENNQEPHFFG